MTDLMQLGRVLVVCAVVVTGYSDKNKDQVAAAFEAAKGDPRVTQLDFQPYVDKKITKMCFQYPYGTQENFENYVKQKVDGFHFIGNDGVSIFWFFLSDGTSFQVEGSSWDVREKSAGCSASSRLYFERSTSGGYSYYLEE